MKASPPSRELGLVPDLQTHIHCIHGRHWLVHPLLDAMPLDGKDLAAINENFRRRSAQAGSYAADGDWFGYAMCHDRPLVLETYARVADRIPDAVYWRTLRQLISTVGDLSADTPVLRELLTADRTRREELMTPTERRTLQGLPEHFAVYGPYQGPSPTRWFWWLHRDDAMAMALAHREGLSGGALLTAGRIEREDVIGFLSDNRRFGDVLVAAERIQWHHIPGETSLVANPDS